MGMKKKAGQSSDVVELSYSTQAGLTQVLQLSINDRGQYSVSDIPSWMHESEKYKRLAEEYEASRNLAKLVAGIVLADG